MVKVGKAAVKIKNAVGKEVTKEVKNHPRRITLAIILLFTLLVAFVGALIQQNWISMLFIVIISILICVPMVIRRLSNIEIPFQLEVFSVLFIYATLFLGELNNYYAEFWWWDVLLHISSGLAFGIVGFIILYVLQRVEKIKASPKIVAIFSFCFALAIGALWEIIEFTIDRSFGLSLQSGKFFWASSQGNLADTMKDLIDDSIGGLFSAVMGYMYLKKNSGIVVKQMAKEFKKDNPRFFKKK